MSALRLVVFDVDGTLVDSQHVILHAMQQAFASLGLPVPAPDAVRAIIGLSLEEAALRLLPQAAPAQIADIVAAYRRNVVENRADGVPEAPLYDGARETLALLHAQDNILMGVATGKARRGLEHMYRVHGIGGYFMTHQTADNHPSKPAPSMLYQALADTGCAVEQAVMVGDTVYDMQMGKAAGFRTLAVTWGYHSRAELRACQPDALVDSFAALPGALEDIWSTL